MIQTRWVDTNKGDELSPKIRCPLVAKEVKKRNNTEEESANFLASTPLLEEAVKFLISEAKTKRVSRNNRPLKLGVMYVRKAHLCGEVLRELYVEPPFEAHELDIVWRLQRAMYGTRDAAAAWEREWTKTLNSVGFESGLSNPSLLNWKKLDAFMMVHGGDFITLGDDQALSEVDHVMSSHDTIQVRAVLGAGRDDAKEV